MFASRSMPIAAEGVVGPFMWMWRQAAGEIFWIISMALAFWGSSYLISSRERIAEL
jgi:hypothetical protein